MEGTGDSEDFVLMEQLSRETRGNGFRSTGREGLGERVPLHPDRRVGEEGTPGERGAQGPGEVGTLIRIRVRRQVKCWEDAAGEDLSEKTENGIAEAALGTETR